MTHLWSLKEAESELQSIWGLSSESDVNEKYEDDIIQNSFKRHHSDITRPSNPISRDKIFK